MYWPSDTLLVLKLKEVPNPVLESTMAKEVIWLLWVSLILLTLKKYFEVVEALKIHR
jgi:hypothetical protein